MKPNFRRYVLSFSFGNYLKGDGGTDKVIAEHALIFSRKKVSYIQIAPVIPNMNTEFADLFSVVIDGRFWKLCNEKTLFYYLYQLSIRDYSLDSIFIHHLMKYNIVFFYHILHATKAPIIIYIHDFYSVCDQYNLLRNGISFCGPSRPGEEKCNGCQYADFSKQKIQLIDNFISKWANRIQIIIPSESTLQIWGQTYPQFIRFSKVIGHQKLNGTNCNMPENQGNVKLAFIGRLIPSKGAAQWDNIVKIVDENCLPYDLYYFGYSENKHSNVRQIRVRVDANHLDAMTQALRHEGIQAVLLWSLWPETYSYTYFEAFSANTWILTSKDSGNIAAMVQKNNNGLVLDGEEKLLKLIADPSKFRKSIGQFSNSKILGPNSLTPNSDILGLLSGKAYAFCFDMNNRRNVLSDIILSAKTIAYKWKNRKLF